MKKLGLTQRVTRVDKYHERRDSLDQRWWPLAQALDFTPVPLPNLPAHVAASYAKAVDLSAVIITGGNTIAAFDPTNADAAPERDAFELAIIDWAIKQHIPMVGICRGMQVINYYFGGTLVPMTGHTATRHHIKFCGRWEGFSTCEVNSYHDWGLYPNNLANELQATALQADGSIEAFIHPQQKVAGIMWHPERENPLSNTDIELLKGLLA